MLPHNVHEAPDQMCHRSDRRARGPTFNTGNPRGAKPEHISARGELVLVPVPLVGCMTVPIMNVIDVIDVIAVRDSLMSTADIVSMDVAGVLHM